MPKRIDTADDFDTNPDPITGAPGSHPVGVGAGAAAGGAAGAAIGSVGGPVGTVVGAAVGAVAGGYGGKAVAESIDPTAEDAYWREHYRERPYAREGSEYESFQPAYRYGWESRGKYAGRSFDEVDAELGEAWGTGDFASDLTWEEARQPARDAWDRIGTRPNQPR